MYMYMVRKCVLVYRGVWYRYRFGERNGFSDESGRCLGRGFGRRSNCGRVVVGGMTQEGRIVEGRSSVREGELLK